MSMQPEGTNPRDDPALGAPPSGYSPADDPRTAYGSSPVVPPVAAPANGLGAAALVLGILAVVTCWTVIGGVVFGILAISLGFAARGRVTRGLATNRGSATAGIVTGVVGLVLGAALLAFGVSILNSPAGKNLQQCLKNANGDSAAVSQCRQQYANDNSNNFGY
jgi:hypothetical protein